MLSFFVIQPGLEPGTYSLEGYCSNPTELLDHPINMLLQKNQVIQPGLEPGTYSLEGYCSNPTELLDHFSLIAMQI